MSEIHGSCKDQFDGVRQTLSRSLDAGEDIGASVAVFIDGEPMVDIWSGYADGMVGCGSVTTRPTEPSRLDCALDAK
jgi:hypothetical protein